jgi:branched-chain amino acid transport system permease protein
MLAAFVYWQLRVVWHWPAPVALFTVLGVLAPVFGVAIERLLLRRLDEVAEVTKLVVSVSLLFVVYQGALLLFPAKGRRLPGFFDGRLLDLGVTRITWHDGLTIVAAAGTALGLRYVLYGTRLGVGMRGVVDDRELSRLNGTRPGVTAALAWAMGASLAAVAGILLAGSQGALSHLPLTLLVINAYGAALFGRLHRLSMTFVGAIVLGLLQSYAIGYINLDRPVRSIAGFHFDPALSLSGLRPALPIVALFVVLLALPPMNVRAGAQRRARETIPSPDPGKWLVATIVLALGAVGAGLLLSSARVHQLGQGLALGIVMLSLVPLIGYAGQISLAPMAFAGIGALIMGTWGGRGSVVTLLLAAAVTGVVGGLVALPTVRLQGLYLALATAAFAVVMDLTVFNQNAFVPNGNLAIPRLQIFSLSFRSDRAHLVLLAVIFGSVATIVVALRRRPFGRRLIAMRSSSAGCVTMGVDLRLAKLGVFALSASIAGLGGALYGAQLRSVSPITFQFLQGLPIVLLAVVGGIASAGGALIGALSYALVFLILPTVVPGARDVLLLTPGLAGITLGRAPDGLVFYVTSAWKRLRGRNAPSDETETVAARRVADDAQSLEWLDEQTGLAEEPLYARIRHRPSTLQSGVAP